MRRHWLMLGCKKIELGCETMFFLKFRLNSYDQTFDNDQPLLVACDKEYDGHEREEQYLFTCTKNEDVLQPL